MSEMSSKELHMSSFDTEIGEDVGKMVPDGEGCVVARVREGVGEVGEGEVEEGGTAVSPVSAVGRIIISTIESVARSDDG